MTLNLNWSCSVTRYNYILFSLIVGCHISNLFVFCLILFCCKVVSSSSFNFHNDLGFFFDNLVKQTDFSLLLDDCHLDNPAANSHPGWHQALLSKPGKRLWFSRQHRVGNDVLRGEPPLEWLRAVFVGVVQMHQFLHWMEWTPAATDQHSNYLPVN